MWAAIGHPLVLGEPGDRPAVGRDADGVACEVDPDPTTTPIVLTAPTGLAVSGLVAVGGALVLGGAAAVVVTRRPKVRPSRMAWP